MNIAQIADEAKLFYAERRDHVAQLESAIAAGKSKRPIADLESRRGRLVAARAIARALRVIAHCRNELPAGLLAEIERDEA